MPGLIEPSCPSSLLRVRMERLPLLREAQEDGIVGETPNLAAPHGSMPRRSNSALIASKTSSADITARVVQRMIAARAAAFPTVKFTYTSSFQYSLTSYLRTSSTQVVSSPCRGISRL